MIKLPRRCTIEIIPIGIGVKFFPRFQQYPVSSTQMGKPCERQRFRFLHRPTCNATSTFPTDESQKTGLSGSTRRKLINYYENNGREDWNETSGT